jgi:hypothetical protein
MIALPCCALEPQRPTRRDFLLGQPCAVTRLMEPDGDFGAARVDELLTSNE